MSERNILVRVHVHVTLQDFSMSKMQEIERRIIDAIDYLGIGTQDSIFVLELHSDEITEEDKANNER